MKDSFKTIKLMAYIIIIVAIIACTVTCIQKSFDLMNEPNNGEMYTGVALLCISPILGIFLFKKASDLFYKPPKKD